MIHVPVTALGFFMGYVFMDIVVYRQGYLSISNKDTSLNGGFALTGKIKVIS